MLRCNNCHSGFSILAEDPNPDGDTFVCEQPQCTRVYKEHLRTTDDGAEIVTIYQTTTEVVKTSLAAKERRKNGSKIDNGGSQEGDDTQLNPITKRIHHGMDDRGPMV